MMNPLHSTKKLWKRIRNLQLHLPVSEIIMFSREFIRQPGNISRIIMTNHLLLMVNSMHYIRRLHHIFMKGNLKKLLTLLMNTVHWQKKKSWLQMKLVPMPIRDSLSLKPEIPCLLYTSDAADEEDSVDL